MPWEALPPVKLETPTRRGVFIDIDIQGSAVIGGDIISTNWDGTVPLELNSRDPGATTGFGLDGSAGNIQARRLWAIVAGVDDVFVDGRIHIVAGTETNPSFTFQESEKDGIYQPTDGEIGFVINENEIFKLDSTGIKGLAWQPWTPTYTNLTVGNGTRVARYVQIGDTVHAQFELIFGSTTTIDATDPTVSMPVTALASYGANDPLGVAVFLDTGTAQISGVVKVSTTSRFGLSVINASGTYGTWNAITSIVPFTWTTGDAINFTATYEAA